MNPKLFRFFFLPVDVIGITRSAKLDLLLGTSGLVTCFRFKMDVGLAETDPGAKVPSGELLDTPRPTGEGVRVTKEAMYI